MAARCADDAGAVDAGAEQLNVTTLICANRRYQILDTELQRLWFTRQPRHGRGAILAVANQLGGARAWSRRAVQHSADTGELVSQLRHALAEPGPHIDPDGVVKLRLEIRGWNSEVRGQRSERPPSARKSAHWSLVTCHSPRLRRSCTLSCSIRRSCQLLASKLKTRSNRISLLMALRRSPW